MCAPAGAEGLSPTTTAQGGIPGATGVKARDDRESVKGAGRYWRGLNKKQKRMKD